MASVDFKEGREFGVGSRERNAFNTRLGLSHSLPTPDSRPNQVGQAFALLGAAVVLLSVPSSSATHKAAKSSSTSHAPAETVYVQTPDPVVASRESRASEPAHVSDTHDAETVFAPGPLREASQAFGIYAGVYDAEVLGANPYGDIYWDLYPQGQSYFFEFTAGGGTVQSSTSESVVGGNVFPHSFMITTEALGGYTYSGLARGDGRSGGLFPYFVGGITAVWQGGVPNIGGVLGFGNRMSLPFTSKTGPFALNYGLRDHIYSQKFRTQPSMTQNLVLLIGVQKYY